MSAAARDEWLWGWDPTPGIVSVWAEADGTAHVWRRIPGTGELVQEIDRFRPWLLLDRLDDLAGLGRAAGPEGTPGARVTFRELEGPGRLRFLITGTDSRQLVAAVVEGASRRLGKRFSRLRDLEEGSHLSLPPEEQYLVASGRNYFREL